MDPSWETVQLSLRYRSSRFASCPGRRRREGPAASGPPIPAVPTAEAAEELGIEVCAASSGHWGSGGCDRCRWLDALGVAMIGFPEVFHSSPMKKSWLEDDPFLFGMVNISVAGC